MKRLIYILFLFPLVGWGQVHLSVVDVWEHNETSGTTITGSISHNGTLYNALNNQAGLLDKCYYLDGNGDYGYIAHSSDYNTNNRSISIWIKSYDATNPSAIKGLFSKSATTGFSRGGDIYFSSSGGIISFQVGNGTDSTTTIQTSTDYYDGNWHLVVGVIEYGASADKIYLYVDGALENSKQTGYRVVQNTANINYGRLTEGSTAARYFNGWIDQVAYWSKALSLADVQYLYNSGNGLPYYQWTKIKKIAGVLDANTKKVAGITDASIKKISGKIK